MSIFRRPAPLPADVRARLDLDADRPLAVVRLAADRWAVASRRALQAAGADGDVLRLEWHDIETARLDPDRALVEVGTVEGARVELQLAAIEDRLANATAETFVQVLRERVQASVVHYESVPLPDGSAVRVAVRRDGEGRLFSQVLGAADLSDPRVAALVDAAESRVRDAAGLAV